MSQSSALRGSKTPAFVFVRKEIHISKRTILAVNPN